MNVCIKTVFYGISMKYCTSCSCVVSPSTAAVCATDRVQLWEGTQASLWLPLREVSVHNLLQLTSAQLQDCHSGSRHWLFHTSQMCTSIDCANRMNKCQFPLCHDRSIIGYPVVNTFMWYSKNWPVGFSKLLFQMGYKQTVDDVKTVMSGCHCWCPKVSVLMWHCALCGDSDAKPVDVKKELSVKKEVVVKKESGGKKDGKEEAAVSDR